MKLLVVVVLLSAAFVQGYKLSDDEKKSKGLSGRAEITVIREEHMTPQLKEKALMTAVYYAETHHDHKFIAEEMTKTMNAEFRTNWNCFVSSSLCYAKSLTISTTPYMEFTVDEVYFILYQHF